MIATIQSTTRESVIGREEAQQRINEMEQRFIEESKVRDEQHNEQRTRLSKAHEELKMKSDELQLQLRLKEGEFEKTVGQLREQLAESDEAKKAYLAKLQMSDTLNQAKANRNEEEFRRREQELEQQLDEAAAELESQMSELNAKSEQQLHELKRFYEDEKDRIERRIADEKARNQRQFDMSVEEYEERINEMTNSHSDELSALMDEKS